MPKQQQVFSVFVASPGDVGAERAKLEIVISELNHTWARTQGVRLELVKWETHTFPAFGDAASNESSDIRMNHEFPIGGWAALAPATIGPTTAKKSNTDSLRQATVRTDARDHSRDVSSQCPPSVPLPSKQQKENRAKRSKCDLTWDFQ
jgi:hypothetical protein